MKLTDRDRHLLRDLLYSQVLSRDQIIELGFFTSVSRANTRLRGLVSSGLIRRLDTPYYTQSLYTLTRKAAQLLPVSGTKLLAGRGESVRFLEHCLAVTNVRLALTAKSKGTWKFEQELWRSVDGHSIRPDGLLLARTPVFIEVDLGHVSLPKFREKLIGYRALAQSGRCHQLFGFSSFNLLTTTTGPLRSRHLMNQLPANPGFDLITQIFDELQLATFPSPGMDLP